MSHIRVKICGITLREDALEAVRLGADALGFNFYTGTPLYIAPDAAAAIIRDLPPWVDPVALFVKQGLLEIEKSMSRLGAVRTVQWHGEDTPIYNNPAYRF